MKIEISRVQILLLVLLGTVALYGVNKYRPLCANFGATSTADAAAQAVLKVHQADGGGVRPHRDNVFDGPKASKSNYPWPVSAWKTNEKAFYTQLLEKEKYDVLIVPFQVQDNALDQATRSVLTARLTELIKAGNTERIPDPYLVARALGDGDRRVNPEQVYALAQHLNVYRIIWAYVGSNGNQHVAVTLTVQNKLDKLDNAELGIQTPHVKYNREGLVFSKENPPLPVAEMAVGELVREMGYKSVESQPDNFACKVEPASLPESPKALLTKADSPAQLAYAYEMYSALTPAFEERTRRRFAEKAYLAVSKLPDSCPTYRLLKARALYQLGYRPAALSVLTNPQSSEEKALVEFLNGNFPELEKLLIEIPSGEGRLLSELDLMQIGGTYGLIKRKMVDERIRLFKLPGRFWPFFFERKFADHDPWMAQNNLPVIALLNYDFPLAGGGTSNFGPDPDNALFEYGRKFWQENLPPAIDPDTTKARLFDYLDLVSAIGTGNMFQQIEFTATVQGLPNEAMHRLDELAPVYKDHPRFALDRSIIELSLANKNPGAAVADNLKKSAYDDAMNAMYWAQGQSPVSNYALSQLSSMNRNDYRGTKNLYLTDLPFHSNYQTYNDTLPAGMLQPILEMACDNSSHNYLPASQLAIWYEQSAKDKLAPFLQQLKGRFHGNQDLTEALITLSKKSPEAGDQEALLKKAIAENPNALTFYYELGNLLFAQGKVNQAFEIYMKYPGFTRDIGDNPVGLSNTAEAVGSYFYNSGYFNQASALYQIADHLNTGAESGMNAHEHLALLRGDLSDAEATLRDRVQRYGSDNAYSEYISVLQVSGHAKDAWSIDQNLIGAGKNSSQWGGAITGFRMAGATEATIVNWAKKLAVGSAKQQEAMNPGRFLLTTATMDRRPTQAVEEALDQIEVPYTAAVDTPHTARRQLDAGHATLLFRMDDFACGGRIPADFSMTYKNTKSIKSDRQYFVSAYRAMQSGDYARAKQIFAEAGQLFDMTCPIVTYLNPYWAFAAAKVNDTAYIENLQSLFHKDDRQFDYYLTQCVLQAFKHDIGGSIAAAHQARLFVTRSDMNGFGPDYSYSEIMEWLYFETKDEKYRAEALDWVAKVEKKYPWAGWVYAMEAELASDPAVRSNAAAMAGYLDPLSARLAKLPKKVRDAAKFTYGNPLLKSPEREHRGEAKI